jgi:nitrate reductase NapAB chaperone NapD
METMQNIYTKEIKKADNVYVQMHKEDYDSLLETIEDLRDIEAVAEAKLRMSQDEQSLPIELTKRIIEGEHPVKVYRDYRGLTQQKLAV